MRKELPIVVGAFADEEQVDMAIAEMEGLKVGLDSIGVCTRVDGRNGHRREAVQLLSIMAPSRLRGDVEGLLLRCSALSVGSAAEMRAAFGVIPHPGVFEDEGMKLPMGPDYREPSNRDGEV
jgi:hypothetical protein